MKEIKKILCAVDLSAHSKAVAQQAAVFAKGLGASITVVSVAPSPNADVCFEVSAIAVEKFMAALASGAESSLQSFVAENFAGMDVKSCVRSGNPADEILRCADEEQADLIIMGAFSRKGVERVLFGSVAEKVVKNAPMPVLTIRPTDDDEE